MVTTPGEEMNLRPLEMAVPYLNAYVVSKLGRQSQNGQKSAGRHPARSGLLAAVASVARR